MTKTTNFVEMTGSVTRVGILLDDESAALELAQEEAGTDAHPYDSTRKDWGWEFSFDNDEPAEYDYWDALDQDRQDRAADAREYARLGF